MTDSAHQPTSTRDEIIALHGEDFFHPSTEQEPFHNWTEICVCGHISKYHSPSTGGSYRLSEEHTQVIRGEPVRFITEFDGCRGALPGRGFETETVTLDAEARTQVTRINVTCPCTKFRPVVRIDRPNRYWNQRLPRDREEVARHPMLVGVRAYMTHLAKRKAALSDPSWADREFDRRFIWIDGARVCGLSQCTTTDGVWPVFVDGEISELRCVAHRP
jgi:hypothetical protein